MLPRKNSQLLSSAHRAGVKASERQKTKPKYLQEIQTFASIPLRGTEQIFHSRLESLLSQTLMGLSRFQLDALLSLVSHKIQSISNQDSSAKLQHRSLKWAAVYFLVTCATALRFATKRPSAALVDHIALSIQTLDREAGSSSHNNSYGSPARLLNFPIGLARRSSYALESRVRAKSASPTPERLQNTTFRPEVTSDLSDPTKTSSVTPVGQPFIIKVPMITTLRLESHKSKVKVHESEKEESKSPLKEFKSPAPVNAFKILMASQEVGCEPVLKKGRRSRSSAVLDTATASQSMRLASSVDETLWAQSDDEMPVKPYKHESKNIERALKRYKEDLKKRNGMPALNLLSYFDEMASE